MGSAGNGQHYGIAFFGSLAQEIDKLHDIAVAAGLGNAFLAALEYAVFRMQHDPWEFGELIQHLKHARLKIHIRIVKPLVIEFGIHEEKPLVLIKRIRLMP
jgi:hypothetical protein